MNLIAVIALVGWIPLILWMFTVLPPRRAVIAGVLVSWLFLPVGGFDVPGLPDYTKSTATSYGLLLGTLFFNARALLEFRPRWFDLPMIVWCLCPAVSALANELGPYDALSAAVNQTIVWGFPYFIGRVYFSDTESMRELAIGLALGGLIYVPFCLWEIRMSPQLHAKLYGYSVTPFAMHVRYGGYRPTVFMSTGLEVGMWMAATSVVAYALWRGRVVEQIRGLPFGLFYLPALIVTSVLCKSTGAILLMAMGIALVWATSRFRLPHFYLAVLLIPPVFILLRATETWSGTQMVDWAERYISADRAQSLGFRVEQEDLLIAKANQRPIFGWGGWGRNRIRNAQGRDISVTDSLWIIAYGTTGTVGLTSVYLCLLLPGLLLLRRRPAASWDDPEVAPAVAMAIVTTLYALDCLFNAMFNPVYVLAAGSVIGLPARRSGGPRASDHPDLAWGDRLRWGGHPAEAEVAYCRALAAPEAAGRTPTAITLRAEAYGRMADLMGSLGRWADAERLYRLCLGELTALRSTSPESLETYDLLARAHDHLGRCLVALGRTAEALDCRRLAEQFRAAVAAASPNDPQVIQAWADSLNNLAWLLANAPDPVFRAAAEAVGPAEHAVMLDPGRATYWNTLGVVYYRCGRLEDAIATLAHASVLEDDGSRAVSRLFLAMAHHERGDSDQAAVFLEEAQAQIASDPPDSRYQTYLAEALSLIRRPTAEATSQGC